MPRARVMSHGPFARDPAAIAVIKERESVDRWLTLDDGSQLEDDGTADVSLFIGRHGQSPRTVAIYAPDGTLLSSHNA